MHPNIESPRTSLIKLIFVIAILYIFFIVVDAFLVSRLNSPETLVKCISTLSLLLCSLFLGKYTNTPLTFAEFKIPSLGWSGVFLCVIVSLILLEISGSILIAKISTLDVEKICIAERLDYFKATRSIILSPALETVLFVKLFPTLYFRKSPKSSPFWVFLVVGIFFSLMHFRFSLVGFGGTLLAGIIFCYVYFGTGSLLASFLVHASLNATLLLLDKFCTQTSGALLYLSHPVLYMLVAIGLAVIFTAIGILHKQIQLKTFI
jgi:membrane protease YdiL (CAAX protease family)